MGSLSSDNRRLGVSRSVGEKGQTPPILREAHHPLRNPRQCRLQNHRDARWHHIELLMKIDIQNLTVVVTPRWRTSIRQSDARRQIELSPNFLRSPQCAKRRRTVKRIQRTQFDLCQRAVVIVHELLDIPTFHSVRHHSAFHFRVQFRVSFQKFDPIPFQFCQGSVPISVPTRFGIGWILYRHRADITPVSSRYRSGSIQL